MFVIDRDLEIEMKKVFVLLMIAATMLLTGCNSSTSLTGEYATKEGGRADIKVTQKDGKYYGAVQFRNKWEEVELRPASRDETAKLSGTANPDIIDNALVGNGFLIAHVKPGTTGPMFRTGYVAIIGFIPAVLYKK
ncbi:hypothetical protein Msip34_2872 (plasmid) [Methylovorus glucosotrophus SIP3-4]|uniref:Lipoprotein n=2 Tax=Methylovorus glucosotrophus TaxID=266009 RepID=C6XEN9_METGS|nr:hypothetical protein Msip34_2872 [Methylovorus glucosotrophus SIP3-4]